MKQTRKQILEAARENRRKAVEFVRANPGGVKVAQLAQHLGLSAETAREIEQRLTRAGEIASIGGTITHRYCMLDRAPALAQALRDDVKQRKIERQRRYEKLRSSRNARKTQEREPLDRVLQVRVNALECKPLRKRGPASVFELGAFA